MALASEEVVRYLEGRDVTKVFGLCGHTNIAVLDALSRSDKIDFINVRHEQIASHAADGYARVTRRASVVLSHLGPGLTNAATGVANAALDSIPMVVIAGDVPTYYFGKHPHQEVNHHADGDQWEIYRPFVKRAFRVDQADKLPEVLDRAFVIAESGRPGPVLVDITKDALVSSAPFEWPHELDLPGYRPTINPHAKQIREAAKMIKAASRPTLYVGGGVVKSEAYEELAELVKITQIPLVTTLMARGAFPDSDPLHMGMPGMHGHVSAVGALQRSDLLITLGQSPGFAPQIADALTQNFSRDLDELQGKIKRAVNQRREGAFVIRTRVDGFETGEIKAYGNGLYLPVRMTGAADIAYRPAK